MIRHIKKIKQFFARKPAPVDDAVEWIPYPDDDDEMGDGAESDAPLPAAALAALRIHVPEVPETIAQLGLPRYRVHRVVGDSTYQAYAGTDGVKAVEAWEAYRHSNLPGDFWFFDSHAPHGHRGTFSRGIA